MKKILFTGGGSGGHVTLNLSLIPLFLQNGWQVIYIGSKTGIEKELIAQIDGVKYYAIETGKLRRYFSVENMKDAMRVPVGIWQAYSIIRREKPNIIFSKGGFVSFPVVMGGYLNRCKKIFMHESDVTPGLANKMSLPFVGTFFTTFDDTQNYVNPKYRSKVQYIGPVLSDRLENGDRKAALKMCDFNNKKPIIMFVGGSLGAQSLNAAVRKNIFALLEKYQIIHICGKGQLADIKRQGYAQFEFVDKEFKDLMAAADVVISRAGSNAIFELLSLKKPMLLVPLPSKSSRGEQSLNAMSFKKHGFADVIKDEDLDVPDLLLSQIDDLYQKREDYTQNMQQAETKQTSSQKLYEAIINE
ncbi:MAG: undecaprenyldiphospho-muramoylpentapeptide beta-N-acetylglucosaminyltransferase [Alphaproteobacteria bacterium]|nr:undecaprenyldiphospho-muramoylpentapeptide beta-N-acetylglucosaminyltransferase [Alphaproteobacteria bacterium]